MIIGMIHVKALPGTPMNELEQKEIISHAIKEAETYKKLGIDTVIIENMHDVPYTKDPGPEITACMAAIGYEIKKIGLRCGIQILSGGNMEALACAKAAGLDFIRAEGFVYAHVGDEGYIESCAGELLRYRKRIGAEDIKIYTDIKKKHSSHALTSDVDLNETAATAEFFLSDGVIITGSTTGKEPTVEDLKEVEDLKIPKLIGSGLTAENIGGFKQCADGFIVGSYFKKDGFWQNELDPERIKRFLSNMDRT